MHGDLLVAQFVTILQHYRRTSLGRQFLQHLTQPLNTDTEIDRSVKIGQLGERSLRLDCIDIRTLDLAAIGDGVLLDQIARDCKEIGLGIEDRIRIADA